MGETIIKRQMKGEVLMMTITEALNAMVSAKELEEMAKELKQYAMIVLRDAYHNGNLPATHDCNGETFATTYVDKCENKRVNMDEFIRQLVTMGVASSTVALAKKLATTTTTRTDYITLKTRKSK